MERKAKRAKDHYIICGMGSIGAHIASEMASTGRPYVIIDRDSETIDNTLNAAENRIMIEGDATIDETLKKAGIDEARGIFATTGDDNLNLVISLTAKQLNPGIKVVARCNNLANMEKMRKAGADSVVSPNHIGGLRMASEMVRPTVVSFLDIMLRDTDKNLRVEEVPTPDSFVGKTVGNLGLKDHPSILLMAVKTEKDWMYNPSNDYHVRQGDIFVFMTTTDARRELEEMAGQ